jgi:probable rRNA maturation factor
MKGRNGPDSSGNLVRKKDDPSLVVSVLNRQRLLHVDVDRIQRMVKMCLNWLHVPKAEVCVVLVSDRSIRKLNWRYLGRKGPTDVIAFSLREGPWGDINPDMMGDVVISLETAFRQAQYLRTSLEEELDVLVVHGLLHLFGFEHTGSGREAKRMWRKQKSIVGMLKRDMQ